MSDSDDKQQEPEQQQDTAAEPTAPSDDLSVDTDKVDMLFDDLTGVGDDTAGAPPTPEPQAPEPAQAPKDGAAAAPPTPPPTSEPEPGPPETKPEPKPPEAAPTQVQEPAPAPQPPVEPQAKPAGPPTTEELLKVREDIRKQIRDRYTVPDEQKEALLTEPEKVLPDMASRIMMDTYDAVMASVVQQLPQLVAAVQQQFQASSSLEQRFYQAWPKLKDPKFRETIRRVATTYRQLNPKAKPEQFIKEVGAQASFILGVPPDATQPTQQQQQARPAPRPAFTPAAPGAASGGTPAQPTSFFDQLAKETEELGY